jgi:hypothetical protein
VNKLISGRFWDTLHRDSEFWNVLLTIYRLVDGGVDVIEERVVWMVFAAIQELFRINCVDNCQDS